jgi:6,7-dimethyl-8-ribityllumazine synthase
MATTGKNLSHYDGATLPNGAHFRVGIVVSEWNEEITTGLLNGAIQVLNEAGLTGDQCPIAHVPGAFELPLAAKWMLEGVNPCDAVIAIGAVIRGETAHFDYVCQGVTQGLMQLGLDSGKPAIFCVLTDDNIEQSRDRSGGKHGNKGIEAAVACLNMLGLKAQQAPKS